MDFIRVSFGLSGMPELDEFTMERVLEEFEQRCYDNMNHAIETEEGLGIEYDEDVVCDVCQSPDGEDGNEMVFCDKCNICVHQVGGRPGCAQWVCCLEPSPPSRWDPPPQVGPLLTMLSGLKTGALEPQRFSRV